MIKEYVHIGLFIGWFVVGVIILKNSFAVPIGNFTSTGAKANAERIENYG